MSAAPVRVYNTLTRSVEPLVTQVPGEVGLYVCGMTVYDYCHIGHARAMMAFDVVVRYLRHRGWKVRFVRNHTDVDDKIIARAAKDGVDPLELSERFIRELEADLDSLGLIRPDIEPRVSRHIDDVTALIASLVARGNAYLADNGDVYFAVETFAAYGKLSGKILDDLRAGERVAVEGAKRNPADFALWKAWSGEAAEPRWPSPWGDGRPGWHIECSAMARHHLGDTFDIHGGGIDLVFPHHENEIAQSECGTGHAPYARVWMHNGHLTLDSEKMSKSLGNIVRIRDIVGQVPAEALRLLYLDAHYRAPLPFSTERLVAALSALDRLYTAKETAQEVALAGADTVVTALSLDGQEAATLAEAFPSAFHAAMDDDFDTHTALAALLDVVRVFNRFANDKKQRARGRRVAALVVSAFELAADALGIGAMRPADFFDDVKTKRLRAEGRSVDEIDARLADRAAARAAKDWARADAIRVELDAMNILVMDGAQGSTWRMRVE